MSSSQSTGRRSAVVVLDDESVARTLDPARAVRWVREAVLAAETGALTSPARVGVLLGDGRIVLTAGVMTGSWFGYRSYDTFPLGAEGERSDQLVVVHDARTGAVTGLAVGTLLGQRRTGALGGLAVDLLARSDAHTVGVIGSGAQAWSQVWAISAVRDVARVVVHSRDPGRAVGFARRVEHELGIACGTATTARAAVSGRDVVVLATGSGSPVVEADWLSPGTHVTTVGPKQVGRAELGVDLLEWADVTATDSLVQLEAYDPPALCVANGDLGAVRSLGSLLTTGREGGGDVAANTLYLSVGLAGSEVHLLHRLLAATAGGDGAPA